MVELSVLVVSWNTRDLLGRCLESIFARPKAGSGSTEARSGRAPFEIVVIDNGSSDESAQMVRERFPMALVVENRENVGFARANCQGLKLSRGKYVLLLNPDTELRPGALEGLTAFMEQHPDAGAAGPRLLNHDGTLQPSCHPEPSLFGEMWRLFHLDVVRPAAGYPMRSWSVDEPRGVDVVQGACVILRTEALDQVGFLDEDYFVYSEEVDLCHRLRRHGWHVYWVPTAEVVHYGGQSTRQASAAMFLHLYRGKVLFFRKNHGRAAARLYKVILLLAAACRLVLSPLALLEPSRERRQHLALAGRYWGLVRALSGL